MSKTTTTTCDICNEKVEGRMRREAQTILLDGIECRVALNHWTMRPLSQTRPNALFFEDGGSFDLCAKHDQMALMEYLEAADLLPPSKRQEE